MGNSRLTKNALSSVLQAFITGLVYFLVYKYLLSVVGVKQLGIWSLVLSTTSIGNLANFGLTSGLVKFVAEYVAIGKKEEIGKLIFSSLILLFFVVSIVLFLFYFLSNYILGYVIDSHDISLAISLIPYSLASLFVNIIGGVFTSTLEGFQKNYVRNYIFVFTNFLFLFFVFFLTPMYSLIGVALAQLLQAVCVLLLSFYFVNTLDEATSIKYWKFEKDSVKVLFRYGVKFQFISILQLMFEPTTKMLLGRFGGLVFVGYYEMASRLVNQFRALIVNANQVVIPVIAHHLKGGDNDKIRELYKLSFQVLCLVVLPLSCLLIVLSPFISDLWIGSNQKIFIISIYVLVISNIVNVFCGPAFFGSLASGSLNLLIKSSLIISITSPLSGIVLNYFIFGYGIIIGWGVGLSLGSIYLIVNYQKELHIRFAEFRKIYVNILLTILCSLILFIVLRNTSFSNSIFAFSLYLIYFAIIAFVTYISNKALVIKVFKL